MAENKAVTFNIDDLKVANVKKWDSGGVTFSLVGGGVRFSNLRVVEGRDGDFIGWPSVKKDGSYFTIARLYLDPTDESMILEDVRKELRNRRR